MGKLYEKKSYKSPDFNIKIVGESRQEAKLKGQTPPYPPQEGG